MVAGMLVIAVPAADRHVRVLSWMYRRDDETVECRLRLTPDDTAYELCVQPPWNPTGAAVELFDDAVSAFDRQTVVDRNLINAGWSLERFLTGSIAR
jgi:hypothetical protein